MDKDKISKKIATGFLALGALASLGFSNTFSKYEAKKLDEAIQRDVVEYVQNADKTPDNIDDYFSQLGISFKVLDDAYLVLEPKLKEIQKNTSYDFSKSMEQLKAIYNLEKNIIPNYKKIATSLMTTFNSIETQINSYLTQLNFENLTSSEMLILIEKIKNYNFTPLEKSIQNFKEIHDKYVSVNLEALEVLKHLPAAKTLDDLVYMDGTYLILKRKETTEELLKKIEHKIKYLDCKIEESLKKYRTLIKSKESLEKVKDTVNKTVPKESTSIVENLDNSIQELEYLIKNYSLVKANLENLKLLVDKDVVQRVQSFEEKLNKMYEAAKKVEDKIDVQKRMLSEIEKLGNGLIIYVGKINRDYPLLYVVEDSTKLGFKLNYLLGNSEFAFLVGLKGETINTINKIYQTDRKTVQGELKGTTQGIGFDVEVLKSVIGDELALLAYLGIENYQGQYSGRVADLYLSGDLGISKFSLGAGVNYQKIGMALQYEKTASKVANSSNEEHLWYVPLKVYITKDFTLFIAPYIGQALRNGEFTNTQGMDLKFKGNVTQDLEMLVGYSWKSEKDSLNESSTNILTFEGIWKNFYFGGNLEINDKNKLGYQLYGGWNIRF